MDKHKGTKKSFIEVSEPKVEKVERAKNLPELEAAHVKHVHRLIYGYLILLIIAVLAGLGTYLYRHQQGKPVSTQQSVTEKVSTIGKTTANNKSKAELSSYQFFNSPKQLGNLNFFTNTAALFGTNCSGNQTTNCPPFIPADKISYVQIGTTPSSQPIVVAYNYQYPQNSVSYVAIETMQGVYKIIGSLTGNLNPSFAADKAYISTLTMNLSSNVSLDTTDTIPALTFPQNAVVDNQGLRLPYGYTGPHGYFIPSLTDLRGTYNQPVKLSDITKIGSNGDITYYEVTAENQQSYSVKEFYAVVGGVYAAAYVPADPITDNPRPDLEFVSGDSTVNAYQSSAFGCGSAYGIVVGNGLDAGQLIYAGVGPDDETLYQLPISSSLFNAFYQESSSNISETAFQSDHAVIVAQNGIGEYVLYERSSMFEYGGCGKPVIYLYPQKTTKVSVTVGANITASAPTYSNNGWQDILASPSGELSYDGQTYNSLYWEGTGYGDYPLITSGTVVPISKALTTISKQLAEQGLNSKEIHDFIGYWGSRLPHTKYVRLTWFDTQQLNELAPLNITPKPETVIRVFLDFQGLNSPISIKPQKFSRPTRKGFTVVEWGGLLRNG